MITGAGLRLVREYFGPRIMGTTFGAAGFASTLGMALGPLVGGWLSDAFGSYGWRFIASSAIGLGAMAVALTFRPSREAQVALPSPSAAH
jgi:MFS family permease